MKIEPIDAIGIGGVACIAIGCAWIYPPLGLISLGGLLLVGAYLGAQRRKDKGTE